VIYLTQLVYVHAGQEDVFHQFEDIAIPLIAKHRGQLMLRLRPNAESVIANNVEVPYEVHIVRFDNEDDLASFARDDERQRFLHLKNQSIRSSLLIKGTAS
jgi:antibiotic biosynthesis monooxygenase (ABM) superfamily enzyme